MDQARVIRHLKATIEEKEKKAAEDHEKMIRHLKASNEANARKAKEEWDKLKKESLMISNRNRQLCSQIRQLTTRSNGQAKKILILQSSLEKHVKAKATTASNSIEYDKLLKKNVALYKQLAENRSSKIVGYNKLEQINSRLTNEIKNLRQAIKARSDELVEVKKLFTPTQFYMLRNRHSRLKCCWNKDDAYRALSLYECSKKAYELLLSRGFPFPSTSTVESWKDRLKTRSNSKAKAIGVDRSDSDSDSDDDDDDLEYQPKSKKIKYDALKNMKLEAFVEQDPPTKDFVGFVHLPVTGGLNIKCEVELTEGFDALEFPNNSDICDAMDTTEQANIGIFYILWFVLVLCLMFFFQQI